MSDAFFFEEPRSEFHDTGVESNDIDADIPCVSSDTACVSQRKTTNRSAHFCTLAFANGESGVRIMTAGQLGDRRLQSPSSRSCNGTTEGPRWPIPCHLYRPVLTTVAQRAPSVEHSAQGCVTRQTSAARDVNPPKQKKRRNEARTV